MLDHEYMLLLERLDKTRGDKVAFFVFADTVATGSFKRHDEGAGWLGIRFQNEPHAPFSEIFIHVRMLDQDSLRQQEALAIIGMNLIFGAFHFWANPETLIRSLFDTWTREREEVY